MPTEFHQQTNLLHIHHGLLFFLLKIFFLSLVLCLVHSAETCWNDLLGLASALHRYLL